MSEPAPTAPDIERAIRNIPDFRRAGIQFKDITPVLADPRLFAGSIDLRFCWQIQTRHGGCHCGHRCARLLIFAAAAASGWKRVLIPIRKKGKLPFQTHEQQNYDARVWEQRLPSPSIPTRSNPGSRVVADRRSARHWWHRRRRRCAAAEKSARRFSEISFLIELRFLDGRKKLSGYPVRSIVAY